MRSPFQPTGESLVSTSKIIMCLVSSAKRCQVHIARDRDTPWHRLSNRISLHQLTNGFTFFHKFPPLQRHLCHGLTFVKFQISHPVRCIRLFHLVIGQRQSHNTASHTDEQFQADENAFQTSPSAPGTAMQKSSSPKPTTRKSPAIMS